MYARFSDNARQVFQRANQEAQRFNHEYLGTEHLLLGLLRLPKSLGCKALQALGIELQVVHDNVCELVPHGPEMITMGKLPQTPRAKKVIEQAMLEARELGHECVGTEHVLLGLLHEDEGIAGRVLRDLGVELPQTRRTILKLLETDGDRPGHASPSPPALEKSSFSAAALTDRAMKSLQRNPREPSKHIPGKRRADGILEGELEGGGEPARTAILRILDASANRAAEGLRVVEDYLRFVLDDPLLTEEVKQLRHELAAAVGTLDRGQLVAARDILGDVGVDIGTDSEADRADAEEVLGANIHRAAQALRSLAEYSKVIEPVVAGRFETLRYQTYQLESTLAAVHAGVANLADVRLYVLVDGRASHDEFVAFVDTLITASVHAIQLRDKELADRELVERGQTLRERIRHFGAKTVFIMNDRPDLAVVCNADGVHVGQEELTVADARKIVGPRRLVGVSTHSFDQACQAVLDGANYIGVGPTFPSATKRFAEFQGIALLQQVAGAIRIPAFAIGGITLDNVDGVLATGIHRVAVSAAIGGATDPAHAVRAWLTRLKTTDVEDDSRYSFVPCPNSASSPPGVG